MPTPAGGAPLRFALALAAALPDLRRVARRQLIQPAAADDLVQLTCVRALERQHQFQVGTNLLGWLCTILRNLHRDDLRRRRHELLVQGQLGHERDAVPTAEETAPLWGDLDESDIRAAAARLPEEMGQAYRLYSFEGLSYLEIARRLGVPMATVATRLYRARLKLREMLTREQPPCAC